METHSEVTPVTIRSTIASKIGFASHQNSVPVLRDLSVANSGAEDLQNVVLSLSANPPFLEAKSWRIDCLRANSTLRITERDIKLNAGFLSDLTESLSGEVTLGLSKEDEVLSEAGSAIEILARNQWGGCGSMPELLPAFCMPNDPAIDHMLKAASDVLRRAGKPSGIDGYESKSRSRTWELASAIWSAVAGLGLSYTLPPASFEHEGQKVRTPGIVIEGRVATCLDSALFFASILEQARLNPLLVMTKGHAFVGVWLQPQEFGQLITDEAAAVRKRVELQELVIFETTLITQSPVPSFSQAVNHAVHQLTDEDFVMAVDIRRARMQRVRPLAAPGSSPIREESRRVAPANEALEDAPDLPAFDVEIQPESDSPADKVALWQRKLLDLTARNRLLHLSESSKCVPFLCSDAKVLEDRLAGGGKIKIVAVPDLESGGRDAALYAQQNREDLYEQYAKDALERGEVLSTLAKAKLESGLVDLYRKAQSDLEEGGANTLFLAMGFLKWKKSAHDPKIYRAPLILLPVKLERKSALSGVRMVPHEDEPRFNLTLLEMLRQDFELTIPGLEGVLPKDENGINVVTIWNMVRQAVRDIPGFEVTKDLVLSTFSFAKYLMWKDLVDRKDQLTKSPLVRHLMERTDDSFPSSAEFPKPEDLDVKIDPARLFLPLAADSSQVAAVVASASDCDFVLDGPPGTGKSQTIANMIAHNLALGRRVLFVAEKRAALDVVYRRLKEKKLGEFCLELHSNKTSKLQVLKQLEQAWDTRDALSDQEWQCEAAVVRQLRERLNDIVALLHQRQSNGMTLYEAIGRVVRDGNDALPRLNWASGTQHDPGTLARFRDVCHRLDLYLGSLLEVPRAFSVIDRREWSNGWQEALSTCARELPPKLDALTARRDELIKATSLTLAADQEAEIQRLAEFVRLLLKTHGTDLGFSFSPDITDKVSAARRAKELVTEYRDLEKNLSLPYASEAALRINLSQVETEWMEAGRKFWIFATLAKKKVSRTLAEQGGATGLPNVSSDLPKLRRMTDVMRELDSLASSLSGIPGWARLSSDLPKMTAALELQEGLRSSVSTVVTSPEHLLQLRATVRNLVVDANGMLAPDGIIASGVARLEEALTQFRTVAQNFRQLCGISAETPLDFCTLREAALAIQERQVRLKAWCDWCRVRTEAVEAGLVPLVQAIENGTLCAGGVVFTFETAYARWFAADVIDSEPRLRNFVSAEHASDIEAYRRMTDRLSELSVRYIRAQVCGRIPAKQDAGKRAGFAILNRELQKQRRHKPLRQLATEMGDALTRLAPCMLMSPLSVAQYLPAELELFDLVIFDEASQIAPWDAIGSIARGKHVVIAGDPRQMPPTSFFNRAAAATDEDEEEDMESILDECLAAGIPSHGLNWHYRSRHESLIAFSNARYYQNALITFPAPVTRESAVTWRRINGVYSKGKGRTNQAEAEALVKETVQRLTNPEFVAAENSIAIVTLNAEQQMLVQDLLDKARRERPEIERFFGDEVTEPVVVKNLETVQGDERDLIMLGIGYGPTEPGATSMSMSFGPLNREGGWRRLNVAITRARKEMMVFTSFDPSMVDLNRTNARAVRDLKHFLEFADKGPKALGEAVNGSVGGYDSPFEEAVADGLINLGWQVVPQIGVSRFRIDLGIVHPERPGDYLLGVECDGASYHSAATARDRDKVRAAILQGLGWTLLRVWSTEWWVDKQGALERLHNAIQSLLQESRARDDEEKRRAAEAGQSLEQQAEASNPVEESSEETQHGAASPVEVARVNPPTENNVVEETNGPVLAEVASSQAIASCTSATAGTYRITDFSEFADMIDPARFYEEDYDEPLHTLIGRVLEKESPISDSLLVQRIARAHRFQRSGHLIRERVLEIVDRYYHLRPDPVGGDFVWLDKEAPTLWALYRIPESAENTRQIDEIPFEELRAASLNCVAEDMPLEIARSFGVRRLSASNRERLKAVLNHGADTNAS